MDCKKLITRLSAILLISWGSVASADSIYRWIDKNGNPHFTRTPPPEDSEYEEVEGSEIESTYIDQETGEGEPPTKSEKELSVEDKYSEQLNRLQKEKEKACQQARKNKEYLLNKHRIRMRHADGSSKMLSHNEKLKQLEIADDAIKANCN
ncbi:DUF4124 domain-containing protein [Sansalvadorimonas sp. 2012CJ34-2]|uniref:DUF4124 domain-containing protein n=1 Tax=Parendozoicomonas callyspongiae TaxID=2942213 RepID=A0ABT0PMP9_9GAMM|nr:DUF4124 domain-containing protein [Sansalvadorimonas sp. 2012CJ34-2]MCL6271753.1 DUF4124 domain-containing protein [Sansalvadorimonas sp. 2012CJ34-2]